MKSLNSKEIINSLSSIKDNPKVLVAIVSIVIVLDVAIFLRSQFVSLGRLFAQARQLKADIITTKEDDKFFSTNNDKISNLNSDMLSLNKMIVEDQDLQKAMETISKYADTSVVRILNIRPEAVKLVLKDAGKASGQKAEDNFLRQRISINAKSGFFQLDRFIGMLENSPIFFDIKSIEIRTDGQEYLKQVVTIVLEIVLRRA